LAQENSMNSPAFYIRGFLVMWNVAIVGGLISAFVAAVAAALLTLGILLGVQAVYPSLLATPLSGPQSGFVVFVLIPGFVGLLSAPLAGGLVMGKMQGQLFKKHNFSAPHWAAATALGLYAGLCLFYIFYDRDCCADLTVLCLSPHSVPGSASSNASHCVRPCRAPLCGCPSMHSPQVRR
jgi:hypothetical protein